MADEVDKQIKRLNYFTGQFLDEKDFQDEQKYHITMRRKLNQVLRGPGVLDDGFTVTCTQATTTTDAKISVGEGLGIDGKGQEIVILSNLEQEISTNELKELFGKTVKICLGYQEKLSDNKKADADISGDTRWSEAPVLTVTKDLPPEDSILLATVDVNSAGNFGTPDYSKKQYSDAKFPHNLTIGLGQANVNHKLVIRGPSTPIGTTSHQDLSYEFDTAGSARIRAVRGSGGTTYLQFLTNPRGGDEPQVRLHIDDKGYVGIGTATPNAPLEVMPTVNGLSTGLQFGGQHTPGMTAGGVINSCDANGHVRPLTLQNNGGSVGIGTTTPSAKLEVVGNVNLESPSVGDICSLSLSRTDESNRRHSWSLWHMNSEYRKNALEIWEYKTDSSGKSCDGIPADGAMCTPRLVILEGGNVGIGIADPKAKLQVSGGAIMPSAGNDDASGILFPENPGGPNAGGDKAWIRYYARSGERTALEIGVANDALNDPNQDDILLMPSGGVGIGTREPKAMLDVEGGAFLGYESQQSDFGAPLKSGFYQGVNSVAGDVPDTGHPWTHLIAARHSNTTNNYQLQIASTFASNDRLFFRKVTADTAITNNPPWYEVATRGSNTFSGDQTIGGSLSISGNQSINGSLTINDSVTIRGKRAISTSSNNESLMLNGGADFKDVLSWGLFTSLTLVVTDMTSTVTPPSPGGAFFSGGITCNQRVRARGYDPIGADLAENYFSNMLLEPGDVVCLDPIEDCIVQSKKPVDAFVCGVISTEPGLLMNSGHDEKREGNFPVALSGRVPCKVTDENGPITRGDMLCSSSIPGRAMKAQPIMIDGVAFHRPGTIIGKALGTLESGVGIMDIFVFSG